MKTVRVVAAVIREDDKIFATARGYGEFTGRWEFPGGKIETGETLEEALKREIKEELDIEISIGDLIHTIEYDYPDFHLSMDCFWATLESGTLTLKEAQDARWLSKDELDSVNWLPADRTLIKVIKGIINDTSKLLNEYKEERICEYKERRYSVRDNGAVMRHPKVLDKPRKNDGIWTFGEVDINTGYMFIAGKRVHQIVATAFLGPQPSKGHVVDHIDTNRQNNRPSNLRWVTRLENILLNDITRKKIEMRCGMPIEEVLEDISILQDIKLEDNISWMRTVSQEEATECKSSWKKWAKKPTDFSSLDPNYKSSMNINSFITQTVVPNVEVFPKNAAGKEYAIPGTFETCPDRVDATLIDYYNCIQKGSIIFRGKGKDIDDCFIASEFHLNEDSIAIKCIRKNGEKQSFLVIITLENGKFVHSFRGFFDPDGLEKYYTLANGEEWTGGDSIDDYC